MILDKPRVARFEVLCQKITEIGNPEIIGFLKQTVSVLAHYGGREIPDFNSEIEAMALTAYCVRNADIVETKLHSEGQRLDNRLMPEFTGTIAFRLYQLLKAKDFLYRHKCEEIWQAFASGYYSMYCSGWKFYSSEG